MRRGNAFFSCRSYGADTQSSLFSARNDVDRCRWKKSPNGILPRDNSHLKTVTR